VPKGKGEGVDFRRGHEYGRIWRVRLKEVPRGAVRDLARANSTELIALLGHSNGWWRDTAQRLLVERHNRLAITGLEEATRGDSSPLKRIHALSTLDGLGALDKPTLRMALGNENPRVREHALRLAQ